MKRYDRQPSPAREWAGGIMGTSLSPCMTDMNESVHQLHLFMCHTINSCIQDGLVAAVTWTHFKVSAGPNAKVSIELEMSS